MSFFNRFKYNRLSYLLTVLVIGIVVMAAYISTQHFLRLDLTGNQEFVLSDSSKKIMQELDDIVTVRVFFSYELPPNLFAVRQRIGDLLSELSSYAKGNLAVRFLDPSDEEVVSEARAFGIPTVRMNILAKDKFEVKNGYLGLALTYGDRKEVIPVIEDTQDLEYELMAAIRKLTATEIPRIGFLQGFGAYPLVNSPAVRQQDTYSQARQALEKNYEVVNVSFDDDSLGGVQTLIINGLTKPVSTEAQYQLDQFIMRGGNVIFMLDGVQVTDDFTAEVNELYLNDLLTHYGASLQNELALDVSNETASFSEGYFNYIVPYPFWLKILPPYLNEDSIITRKLDSLILPWASPLKISAPESATVSSLANSTENAWLNEAPFDLDPNIQVPAKYQRDQYALAALMEGVFTSNFTDHYLAKRDADFKEKGKSRLLLVGNARFLTDYYVAQYPQNLDFFLNAVDYLTLDEGLIGIRSRTITDRPLILLTDQERQWIKGIGVFLMPLLLILYGILRVLIRKRRKIEL